MSLVSEGRLVWGAILCTQVGFKPRVSAAVYAFPSYDLLTYLQCG
jgi:hypothetical protein